MDARIAVLAAVADALPDPTALRRHILVGIDGVDGSGKTTFADELASAHEERGARCIRISLDDFHALRADRRRRGRDSPRDSGSTHTTTGRSVSGRSLR